MVNTIFFALKLLNVYIYIYNVIIIIWTIALFLKRLGIHNKPNEPKRCWKKIFLEIYLFTKLQTKKRQNGSYMRVGSLIRLLLAKRWKQIQRVDWFFRCIYKYIYIYNQYVFDCCVVHYRVDSSLRLAFFIHIKESTRFCGSFLNLS